MIQMTQSLRERENDTTIHKNEQVHDFFPDFQRGLAAGFPQNGGYSKMMIMLFLS